MLGHVDGVERREGFLCPVRLQQPLRDLGGYARHAPHRFVLQGDERVDVALRIGDRHERPLHRPVAMALGDLVGIERAAAGPAHDLPVLLPRDLYGRLGELHDARLQPVEADRSERRREHLDEAVELAVVVLGECAECLVGQRPGIGRCLRGHRAEITAGGVEFAHHREVAVIAAIEHRSGQPDELPEQVERFRRIGWCNVLHDGPTLHLQVSDEVTLFLPIELGTRPADGGEPLADLPCGLGRPRRTGELQPEPALDLGVALAELDQQPGQAR